MDFKCFIEGCSFDPSHFCSCQGRSITLCEAHQKYHCEAYPEPAHQFKPLYREIPASQTQALLAEQQQLLDSLTKIEGAVLNSFSSAAKALAKTSADLSAYFDAQHSLARQRLGAISNFNLGILLPEVRMKHSPLDFLLQCQNTLATSATQFCNKITEDAKAVVSQLPQMHRIVIVKKAEDLDEHIYFFKQKTKTFVKFDTLNLSVSELQININDVQGFFAGICQISATKVFYNGGYDPYLSTAYIIDLPSKTALPLARCRIRSMVTANYYKKAVYFFGGYNGFEKNDFCDKYDLKENRWVSLAKFPIVITQSSAIGIGNTFVITTGYDKKVFRYTVDGNQFQELAAVARPALSNVIFRDGDKLFIIAGSDLFKSNLANPTNWERHHNSLAVTISENTSKVITRGRFVFFHCCWNKKVYKFNLDSFLLEEVRVIE